MRYRAEIFTFVYVMGVANAGVILVYLRKTEHWVLFLGLFCTLCIRYILSTGYTLLVWDSEVKGQSRLSDKNVQQEYLYRRNELWKSRRTINLQWPSRIWERTVQVSAAWTDISGSWRMPWSGILSRRQPWKWKKITALPALCASSPRRKAVWRRNVRWREPAADASFRNWTIKSS